MEKIISSIENKLSEDGVRKLLAKIFKTYIEDLQPILTLATAENDGIRPEGLVNEIYASFHHVARALTMEDSNGDEIKKNLISAEQSHLKRAIYDSYKIAINAYLREESKLADTLDYLVLVDDFEKFVPDGINRVREIKQTRRQIVKHYRQAMTCERNGDFIKAIKEFNSAIVLCGDIREKIEVFTKNKSYLFACAREAKLSHERSIGRKTTVIASIGAAIVSAILSSSLTFFLSTRGNASYDKQVGSKQSLYQESPVQQKSKITPKYNNTETKQKSFVPNSSPISAGGTQYR